MNGVTTAIVAFCFAGLALPGLVKNRPQYYVGLGAALLIIFLDGVAHTMTDSKGLAALTYMFCAVLQMIALIAFVLSAGGLTFAQFRGEMGDTIEVLRRGETHKEVIIPLPDEIRRKVEEAAMKAERAKMANPPVDKPAEPTPPKEEKSGPMPLA